VLVSAVLIVLIAAGAASWAGLAAQRYHRDRLDMAEAEEWIAVLRSMRDVSFDDHVTRALAVVDDELAQRRLEQAQRRHPAGGAR
jgi:hypothetical protein